MTTNKGGRPPSEDGPLDDKYDFRGPSRVLQRFRSVAGKSGPSVCIKLLSWWLGIEGAELPERPCDARKVA